MGLFALRWFARLIVLGLVPVVWLAGAPAPAQALAYGSPATGYFGYDKAIPGDNASCAISGYFVANGTGAPTITVKGQCKRGFLSELEDLTIDARDSGCAFYSDYENDTEQGGFTMVMTAAPLPLYDRTRCNITEGVAHMIDPSGNTRTEDRTFPWTLGQPPLDAAPAAKTCQYATMGATSKIDNGWAQIRPYAASSPTPYTWSWAESALIPVNATATKNWYLYTIQNKYGGRTTNTSNYTNQRVYFDLEEHSTVAGALAQLKTWTDVSAQVNSNNYSTWSGTQAVRDDSIIGYGIAVREVPAGAQWSLAAEPPATYTGDDRAKFLGVNDASLCRFYWGAKLWNSADTTADEPGVMGDPVVPPTEPTAPTPTPPDDPAGGPTAGECGSFSLTDPTSWIGALACNLLKAIKGLYDGVMRIVNFLTTFYTELGKAFLSLFVPETDLSEWSAELSDSFDNKVPFAWFKTVASMPDALPRGSVPAGPSGVATPKISGAVVQGQCPNWKVKVMGETYDPVCTSSFTAAIRGSRAWFSGMLIAAAFWPLLRGLMYASVPLIKPTPSGGDK